jgi:hypothetical protein
VDLRFHSSSIIPPEGKGVESGWNNHQRFGAATANQAANGNVRENQYQVNFSRLRLGIGFALALAIASVTAGLAQTTGAPATPAPGAVTATPAGAAIPATGTGTAPAAAPSPVATASSGPRRGRRAPGTPGPSTSASPAPSDTPVPPQFSTLDGIWEVEMQPLGKRLAVYSHLSIAVTGSTINGYWEHNPGRTRSPMKGTFDGRLI